MRRRERGRGRGGARGGYDKGRGHTCYSLGRDEQVLVVSVVEVGHALPGEFQMLSLVIADGHVCGAVDEDVGGLEDWVGEQPKF